MNKQIAKNDLIAQVKTFCKFTSCVRMSKKECAKCFRFYRIIEQWQRLEQ